MAQAYCPWDCPHCGCRTVRVGKFGPWCPPCYNRGLRGVSYRADGAKKAPVIQRDAATLDTRATDEQQAIYNYVMREFAKPRTERRVLFVNARAGTGKTHSMAQSALRVPGVRTLAIAFNKNAEIEFSGRVHGLQSITVKTSNAYGNSLILKHYRQAKLNTKGLAYTLLMGNKREGKSGFLNLEGKPPKKLIPATTRIWDLLRNLGLYTDPTPDDILSAGIEYGVDLPETKYEPLLISGVQYLASYMRANGHLTYDYAGQLWLPNVLDLTEGNPFDLGIIDEGQDQSKVCRDLGFRALSPTGLLVVVGDDRQAIYRFRGADSDSLACFRSEVEAKGIPYDTLPLTINWRCPLQAIRYAQTIVPEIKARPDAPEGITQDIEDREDLIPILRENPAALILSRTNAPLFGLCLSLIRAGIRAKIRGKDFSSQLIRLLDSFEANDLADFSNALSDWYSEQLKVAVERNDDRKATEVEDIYETLNTLSDDCTSVAGLREKIDDLTAKDDEALKCELSTVHKAKGNEHERVYVLNSLQRLRGGEGAKVSSWDVNYTSDQQGAIERDNLLYITGTRTKLYMGFIGGRPVSFESYGD